MKKLFILFGFVSVFGFSQEIKLVDGVYKLSEVVEVNASKDEIYKKIKTYLNQETNKSKYVIDVDDPSIGMISYNEVTPEYAISKFELDKAKYKVTTEIKDNKFRYSISNIIIVENLMGLELEKDYADYIQFMKTNDDATKFAKQKLLDDIVSFQKTNISALKSFIERKDEW
ncbi:DUF4468 domain-containing protein [Chryseobacterium manosquense]|uniref:DUF4468 domain-containing protein n=1 Tax=Chryseobacterium manosquense TaxID=2754694 RepID=A0A7H1DT32_9FLAO|nr:DUF4468 domain-containing protein [Chryseobacterium manosquense]QNS40140.1 DUF4468 domain-containing protein [Chryseobacterium manosquense]